MDPSTQAHETLSSARKNKRHSQRQYRFKESDGFSELRHALQAVVPMGMMPHGRVTRHQLLTKAAEQLRHLAKENQELMQHMSGQYPVFNDINHLEGLSGPGPGMALDLANQPYPTPNTQSAWPIVSCPQKRVYAAPETESGHAYSNPLHSVDRYW